MNYTPQTSVQPSVQTSVQPSSNKQPIEIQKTKTLLQNPILFFIVLVLVIFAVQLYSRSLNLILQQTIPIKNEIIFNIVVATIVLLIVIIGLRQMNIPIIELEKISEI